MKHSDLPITISSLPEVAQQAMIQDMLEADYAPNEGVDINKEWKVRYDDLIKLIAPGVLMCLSGAIFITCSLPIWVSNVSLSKFLKISSNASLVLLGAAAEANLVVVSKMMLTRALYEGFPMERLKSAMDSSLLGISKWLSSFSLTHKNISIKEKILYSIVTLLCLFFLTSTPIILATNDSGGEWNVGFQRLGYGNDIFTAYEAFTFAMNDLTPSSKDNTPSNNFAKFGQMTVDRHMLDPQSDDGVLLPNGQVWSGYITMLQASDFFRKTKEIGGTAGSVYPEGVGVIGTVSCTHLDMDDPRLATLDEATAIGKSNKVFGLQNRTCLGTAIERLNPSAIKNVVTFHGWNMKEMQIPFNLYSVASPVDSTQCLILRTTCGLSVARTRNKVRYRDGRLIEWNPQHIMHSDVRDQEAAELVFQWLQGAMLLTSAVPANLTEMITVNRLKQIDYASVWTDKFVNGNEDKKGFAGMLSDVLQKVLRACMMNASSPVAIATAIRSTSPGFDTNDSWDAQKSKMDPWLKSHDLPEANAMDIDITQNTGRPYGLVGLIIGCLLMLTGFLLVTFYMLWYVNNGPMHRLIWDRLSNFTRLAEALGGPKVGHDYQNCALREPQPNNALVRFGVIDQHLEINKGAEQVDPFMKYGSY